MISGGKAVVQALLAAGVDHAFCVPGESFLGLLDALYDAPQIRVIATRHEGGAVFMAEAYGKRHHPGRQIATALGLVDFAAMARALGAEGVTVDDEQEFGTLLGEALHATTPIVFHLRVDPEQISVVSDVA